MFMDYEVSQWIQVGIWLFLMIILFTGTFAVSCIISNKFIHKKNKRRKKVEKKSYFIDVA